jgi:hypothetical protein
MSRIDRSLKHRPVLLLLQANFRHRSSGSDTQTEEVGMLTTATSNPLRGRLLQTTVLAFACASAAVPGLAHAAARNAFDGAWSVIINTQSGACEPSFRYGVQIFNGQVLNNGGSNADIQGRVSPNGMVRVNVRAGGQWASGSGRLDRARGGGMWQGQGSAGTCSGTWVALRSGAGAGFAAEEPAGPMAVPPSGPADVPPGGPVAEAPGAPLLGGPFAEAPSGPTYNFVPPPGQIVPMPEAQGQEMMSYCAARFHSFDPASGTYLGYDGLRHPCP